MIGGLWKSTSSVALFAAAGLFVGGVAMPSAKAADLGGDCCADLEERVAELEATTARKGNRRVSLTISGQVNTALLWWDAGTTNQLAGFNTTHSRDVYIVDNAVSRSGFGLDGSARINPNLTAGFQIAIGIANGARGHQLSQGDDDGVGQHGTPDVETYIAIELANWYLDHKALGRITVGRINTASAGATTVDLGGAGVVANANIGLWQRSFANSINTTWSQSLGGSTVNVSGLSRANAISYTTPTLGGFSAQVAWGENDLWDAALRFAGEFSGFRVAAAIAYGSNIGGTDEAVFENVGPVATQWKGSASVLHVASGLYLTAAYMRLDNDNPALRDTTLWYVQGGITKNWTGIGNTVLYGEYANVDNPFSPTVGGGFGFTGTSESSVWGLGIVQHIDAAAMEVYLSYRHFQVDSCSGCGQFNDFDAVMGGARIRF